MFMTVYDIVLWIGNESMKTVVIYNTINFFFTFLYLFSSANYRQLTLRLVTRPILYASQCS